MATLGDFELDQIYTGDARELAKGIPDGSVDLVVTSPPYDNMRAYKGFTFDFEGIAKELYRITKPGGVVVWVVGDATIDGSETGTSFRHALHFREIGFNIHDTMIYEKSGSLVVGSLYTYRQIFEYMFVFSRGKPARINLIADKQSLVAGKKSGTTGTRRVDGVHRDKQALFTKDRVVRNNIWRIHAGNNGDDYTNHPAVFPESLARDHILTWSNPGDVVLDPMCGSGTTCKMAKQQGRRWIGFDISPEYCELARRRVAETQPPLFVLEHQQAELFGGAS